jgi:predicted transport protein
MFVLGKPQTQSFSKKYIAFYLKKRIIAVNITAAL